MDRSSDSAEQPAHDGEDCIGNWLTNDSAPWRYFCSASTWEQPMGETSASSVSEAIKPSWWEDSSAQRPAHHCIPLSLFAKLPADIWRRLIGLLLYSDVAACSCSTSHEDTKLLLVGYMRRRCCISTFKRLLAHFGVYQWEMCSLWSADSEHRKLFWKVAVEMIFLYETILLQEDQRCEPLVHQDYIHSCGILFASEAYSCEHSELQMLFRRCYGAPNHLVQPWSVNSYGIYSVAGIGGVPLVMHFES